ncbi:Tubulointerstitial Nephritis Antigen [Manis pentadactyla]|nr:Tubulointerstitial Nephritis Antigen [Manis pentadactyla]
MLLVHRAQPGYPEGCARPGRRWEEKRHLPGQAQSPFWLACRLSGTTAISSSLMTPSQAVEHLLLCC